MCFLMAVPVAVAVAVVRQTMPPPKWNCAFQLPHALGLLLECIFGFSLACGVHDRAMQLRSTGSMDGKCVRLCSMVDGDFVAGPDAAPLFNMSDAAHYEQQRIVWAGAGGSSAVSL